jgi:hypothetical protein
MITGKSLVSIYSYLYDIVFMKYKYIRGVFIQPTIRGYHMIPRFFWQLFSMRSNTDHFKFHIFKALGNLLGKAIAYYLFARNRRIKVKVNSSIIEIVPAKVPVSEIYPGKFYPDMSRKQLVILGHKVPVGLVYINGKRTNYVFIPSKRYVGFVINRLIYGEDAKISGVYVKTNSK